MLYLQPTVIVKAAGLVGPTAWLKPYVSCELQTESIVGGGTQWAPGIDDLFIGIQGGLGLMFGPWTLFNSDDLLGVTPVSYNLYGSAAGSTGTAPTALSQSLVISKGSTPIQLLATDAEGDSVTYTIKDQPSHGVLSALNSLTGSTAYTPYWGYAGGDSFTFTAFDGSQASASALVSLDIQDGSLPIANFSYTSPAPLQGSFDASSSVDLETPSGSLAFRWDFDDNGTWEIDWSLDANPNYIFGWGGSHTVKLEVKDLDEMVGTYSKLVNITTTGPGPSGGMVQIPGGTFVMGDHQGIGWTDELPLHTVTLDSFYMDVFETTNQAYADYLNSAYAQGSIAVVNGKVVQVGNGTVYCSTTSISSYTRIVWDGSTFTVTSGKLDHPMIEVSWYGALAFANWRSAQDGLAPCYDLSTWSCNFSANGYRLPTEAEWEYAARGGLHSPYYTYSWGNSIDGSKANYAASGDPFETGSYPQSTPVGYYDGGQTPSGVDMANGYGLYDMAGNMWEWCWDRYDWSYYSSSPSSNPHGPSSSLYASRVIRGGSWNFGAANLRSAQRFSRIPGPLYSEFGFRLVRITTK